jgi:hypothetical protein
VWEAQFRAAVPATSAAAAAAAAEVAGEAPVPVAQAQIGGTAWYEVKCSDGRRYFFNHSTQQTLWSMPPEVRWRFVG